jgi:hypothetical protein
LQIVAHGEPSDVIELNTVSEPVLGQEEVLASKEALAGSGTRFSINATVAVLWSMIASQRCRT